MHGPRLEAGSPGDGAGKKGGNWGKVLLALLRHGGSMSGGVRPFLNHLVQKSVPGAEWFKWARLDVLASELRITDMAQLLEYMLYRKDEVAFGDTALRHFVLGELDMDGGFVVHMGSPPKDQFFRSQEAVDKAARPHLLVRAGENTPPRHMQIAPDQFAALAMHRGAGVSSKWWPSLGKVEEDGKYVGINWRHRETGQVLVNVPPPLA